MFAYGWDPMAQRELTNARPDLDVKRQPWDINSIEMFRLKASKDFRRLRTMHIHCQELPAGSMGSSTFDGCLADLAEITWR